MKRILLIVIAGLLSLAASAQDGRKIYNRYSDSKGVESVYVSPFMYKLFGKLPGIRIGETDVDLGKLIKSYNGLYILNTRNTETVSNIQQDVRKYTKSGKYELMIETKEDGDNVTTVYATPVGEFFDSLLFVTADEDDLTFVCLDARVSKAELRKLLKSIKKNP